MAHPSPRRNIDQEERLLKGTLDPVQDLFLNSLDLSRPDEATCNRAAVVFLLEQ